MFLRAWLKRLHCGRLLTLVLFLYFVMILLFAVNLDFTEPDLEDDDSFGLLFPESTFYTKRGPLLNLINRSASAHKAAILGYDDKVPEGVREIQAALGVSGRSKNYGIKFVEPIPLIKPLTDNQLPRSGDFISIGVGAYVYSAFIDDRKENRFIRIMTLMSQQSSKEFIYCHFNDTPGSHPTKSHFYELCENHGRMYGAYFYSCPAPENRNGGTQELLTAILISFTETGRKVKVPVQSVQPPEHKLAYLDLYRQEDQEGNGGKSKSINMESNVPFTQWSPNNNMGTSEQPPSSPTLSFAICVSPLFGNISVHRLVEFVELSRLLGADHIVFYNHSVSQVISDVLRYYMNKGIVSVLPWTLPPVIDSIWYYGQLLANNDCLYRTMPHFDLVSFNDIDEFIVPHSNDSNWKDAFSPLLTDDRCGFSFQSAFYDPGYREPSGNTLLTPSLTTRSQMYSMIRTKVVVCPWRVFEIGIHHISKQNRENWRSWPVPTSVAYLHHYRRCVSNFGMLCDNWVKDFTIAERYLKNLTLNYERELYNIALLQENFSD